MGKCVFLLLDNIRTLLQIQNLFYIFWTVIIYFLCSLPKEEDICWKSSVLILILSIFTFKFLFYPFDNLLS